MDLAALQQIALDVAGAREVGEVLQSIAGGLARESGVALARIWLIEPGDICEECSLRAECPDRARCLHLVASAGRSRVDPDEVWERTDGRFRRFPLGVRKVGRVGSTGAAALLSIGEGDDGWLADPEWATAEGLRSFAAQPLTFRGEVLGVLALFTRSPFGAEDLGWLRTFADHAAVAIANARAFEELAALREKLQLENDYLREEMRVARSPCGIVGESRALIAVLEKIDAVAPTDATVLIEGESGTGKELVVCTLHEKSNRRDRTLVRVNCASIPGELFESEFFGHVEGSFTGATRERAGRFQVADGGTLFLDEVGEIPLELQGKLLRALQEGKFSRVGEDDERSVDVRVVAATNRDLEQDVEEGRFRRDLFYRLSVFPVRVPPLRERPEDVPLLARHFLELASRGVRPGSAPPRLDERHVRQLAAYDWPGNVRELQNAVERAVIGARGGELVFDLPAAGRSESTRRTPEPTPPEPLTLRGMVRGLASDGAMTYAQLEALERENVLAVLNRTRWKIAGPGGAAEFLGIHPATLSSRLKAMGIERPRSSQG